MPRANNPSSLFLALLPMHHAPSIRVIRDAASSTAIHPPWRDRSTMRCLCYDRRFCCDPVLLRSVFRRHGCPPLLIASFHPRGASVMGRAQRRTQHTGCTKHCAEPRTALGGAAASDSQQLSSSRAERRSASRETGESNRHGSRGGRNQVHTYEGWPRTTHTTGFSQEPPWPRQGGPQIEQESARMSSCRLLHCLLACIKQQIPCCQAPC